MTQKELDQLQKKALQQFKSGQSLFGKDGAFAPMLKQFLEAALQAEMDAHLSEEQRQGGNKRNGKGSKTIKSAEGTFQIATPQDRQSSFAPQIIKKRETILADNLADKIIGLYGLGMSLRDISAHISEMYDSEISHTVLGEITDRIIPEVKAWQSRPLEPVYCIVWLEQLLAESTGKEGKGVLPVTGETLLDPSAYGDDRLFVYLHLKGEDQPDTKKKLNALTAAGHPLVSIEIAEKPDIAQEFYRWEMAVAAAGAVIGINVFNQPNVQESKDDTDRLLKKVEGEGSLPSKEPVLREKNLSFYANGTSESAEALLHSFLSQAGAGDYIAIQAYLTEEPQTEQLLQQLRTALQQRYKRASTIGYGPRFLHSTGQYHKGGPNTGLFIQLTADDETAVEVPGTNYSFGTFKHAEGDLEALQHHERKIIRIDLNSKIHKGIVKLIEWVASTTGETKLTSK